MSANIKTLKVNIDSDLLDRVAAYCKEKGCFRNWFISQALEKFLDEYSEAKSHPCDSLEQAIEDSRTRKNLYGPYDNVKDAVDAMLED